MKLWSSYIKELKIAARGFYFYIELGMAIILLLILLIAVKDNPVSKTQEFVFYDMPPAAFEALQQIDIDKGTLRLTDPAEFELKPVEFTLKSMETGEVEEYVFPNKKVIYLDGAQIIDPDTGELDKTIYYAETREDLLRLAYAEKAGAGIVLMDENGELSYEYPVQGYETERHTNLLYIIHNESLYTLADKMDSQEIRALGSEQMLTNKQNLVPLFVVFAGALMGLIIVMAYIFLDKTEGVIRAFAVTPGSVSKYLLSKILVILTTVIVSSSVITIPIMGGQPNYLLFYLFLIITTFAFTSVGLLVASFFNALTKSFGAIFILIIALMLPAFSYFIPSFDPIWLRFFPTYPVLQGFKEILLGNGDISYILTSSAFFLIGGVIVFFLAEAKFKKTLTV